MDTNDTSPEKAFLMDLVESLLKDSELAQTEMIKSKGLEQEGFDAGVVQGYWQVLSSILSRMHIYELDLDDYGLTGYDPDSIWDRIRQNLSTKDDSQNT